MKRDPKDIVREGYDRIAELYDEYSSQFNNEAQLNEFMSLVKPGGQVLDVGCGTGIPFTRALVDSGFQVTGIDISQKMLDLAKQHVPEATFEIMDMTAIDFEDHSFDGIISAYAVFHVPRSNHFSLLQDFHRLLKKGGSLLFSVGSREDASEGVWEWDELQSVSMFWSNYPPSKTVELVESANFEIIFARRFETQTETETEVHFWILARAM